MKKKVLLMGASGSGKTSMRSLIFSNNPASLTSRLGATIDVEQNHVRFLGDLILNLWDCGGQDAFMDSYLSTQQSTIFQHVGVLIYVFDVAARDVPKDMKYYCDCLAALRRYSPSAAVFTLVHKMDLARSSRETTLEEKTEEIEQASEGFPIKVFGTSIYDESLYKAWSRIARTLIPNAYILSKHLGTLATACGATEVVLFERTTFLVIAASSPSPPPSPKSSPPLQAAPASTLVAPTAPTSPTLTTPETATARASSFTTSTTASGNQAHRDDEDGGDPHQLTPARYERTSEIIKSFKHACARVREEFRVMELELADFTAVLDELTRNTYVLVIAHDPTIETAAIRMNIRLARKKFEELQSDSLVS